MAGFMSRLNGYSFPGETIAHAELVNGQLVSTAVDATNHRVITAATVADSTTVLRIVEVDVELGDTIGAVPGTDAHKKGIRVDVVSIAAGKEYWLVENAEPRYELNFAPTYDLAEQKTAAGQFVRMHRIQEGEQFVTSLWTKSGTTAFVVGDTIGVLADGYVGA